MRQKKETKRKFIAYDGKFKVNTSYIKFLSVLVNMRLKETYSEFFSKVLFVRLCVEKKKRTRKKFIVFGKFKVNTSYTKFLSVLLKCVLRNVFGIFFESLFVRVRFFFLSKQEEMRILLRKNYENHYKQ